MKKNSDSQLGTLVDGITHDIILGRLRPRERLIEDELLERFDVSRHQIRSALGTLEQMGLVARRRNRGSVVRDFSVREVEETYDMRALLQGEAARRIPMPADQELLNKLENINAGYCDAVAAGDLQLVCSLNSQFHQTIFEACNNQCLAELIERLWTKTLGMRCYGIGDPVLLKRSQQEHSKLIGYLKIGDREPFVRLCVDHIWPALESYKRAHGGWSHSSVG